MSDEACMRCGYPRGEHHYMGACYGICGEFIERRPDAMSDDISEHVRKLRSGEAIDRTAIANALEEREWQPIETAPMDVDLILGWWCWWPSPFWKWSSGLAGSTKGGWLHGQATHWLSAPSPHGPPTRPAPEPPTTSR